MPQKVLYELGIDALFKQECCGSIAQLVDA